MRQSYPPQSGNILHCPLAHFYSAVDKKRAPDEGARLKKSDEEDQEQPLVDPQVLHFMQVPLRTSV